MGFQTIEQLHQRKAGQPNKRRAPPPPQRWGPIDSIWKTYPHIQINHCSPKQEEVPLQNP